MPYESEYPSSKEFAEEKRAEMEQRKRILEANPDADPDADLDPITASIKVGFDVFDESVEDDDAEDKPHSEQKYDHADLDTLYAQHPPQLNFSFFFFII